MSDELIYKSRKSILNANGSEVYALTEKTGLSELFEKQQKITSEMNKAIKDAIEKAKEPFLKELEQINKEYATLLQFVGNNGASV